MMRHLLSALGLALACSYARPASAQLLGAKGDAIFSAERLFGVRGEHVRHEPPAPAPHTQTDDTVIAFGFANTIVPYNVPRLAFDYMVVNQLSLGGALGFSLSDASNDFIVAPRVGFLHMFGRVAGIWPRGGFFYHSRSVDGQYRESSLGLNLECMFPIVVAGHFGFELGLTFDQSLTGKHDPDPGPSYDVEYRSIGLQVGLLGWI
jgi:hypothetical protein